MDHYISKVSTLYEKLMPMSPCSPNLKTKVELGFMEFGSV